MFCYAVGAPVAVFSAAFVLSVLLGLADCLRVRADRELRAALARENALAYFTGDATFHLGRVRVLLDHGFTNRDIYLAEYHFQHIYHTNLLFPIYAAASQLTGQSYLAIWFHSQVFAKLLVAAGHYVLGYAVTRRKLPAWLLALTVITANAGESYTTYPNTVAVGWLLPMQLAAAFTLLTRRASLRYVAVVAACSFVTAQVHALYAVYAGLALGPGVAVLGVAPVSRGRRGLIALGLLGALAAAPFLAVSQFAFKPKLHVGSNDASEAASPIPPPSAAAPSATNPAQPVLGPEEPPDPPKWLPEVDKGKPIIPTPAVAMGGGHLEKSLELDSRAVQVWMAPEKMGGKGFVALGFIGFALAIAIAFAWAETREQCLTLMAAALGAVTLAVILFWPPATTLAVALLDQPFTVARLSTVLSSLLLLGIALGLGALVQLVRVRVERRDRASRPLRRSALFGVKALVLLLAVAAATRLTGHAPVFFNEVVDAALRPREVRYATLDMLEARRAMLRRVVPPGTTILTTARFARSVVMLCDCYVIIADRGHTYISFARDRREQLVRMNAPMTPWPERRTLIQRYGLKLVVFESRHLARLYRWSHEHGSVIGTAAGLEVVQLRDL
jgi:hypothetical protein